MSRVLCAVGLLGCVVAANVATAQLGLVSAGFGLVVTAGTYAAGLALVLRDLLDQAGGLRWVLPTLAAGVVLSAALATPALAVASAVAFALSELADLAVFRRLRGRSLAWAVAGSGLVGAVVDTCVFLPLAGFPVTAAAVGGQVLVKAGYCTVLGLVVIRAVRRDAVVTAGA